VRFTVDQFLIGEHDWILAERHGRHDMHCRWCCTGSDFNGPRPKVEDDHAHKGTGQAMGVY